MAAITTVEAFGTDLIFAGVIGLAGYSFFKILTGAGAHSTSADDLHRKTPLTYGTIIPDNHRQTLSSQTQRKKVVRIEEVPYDKIAGAALVRKWAVTFKDDSTMFCYSRQAPVMDGDGYLTPFFSK